ncbi:MAG TPA: efflux RND transporter periplasmic adaptor subunit [Thermoanaerobaculia bacterium]|jgi:RND family efflux transporter MFP subunit|nr:efflux RND transporter periplasmic adaptor subunit [Thermoanaerobaculia bacterium]
MSVTEERQRPDLSALRIHREDDDTKSVAWGTIFGWIVAIAVVLGAAYAIYVLWIGPRRAPLVDTIVVKPAINVTNPPLLTATGYLVADKQSKITPKISGKVVRLNFDVGDKVTAGQVLAVLESTNMQAQLDESQAALTGADREWKRQSAMWKEGVTTHAQLDSAEAQFAAARARVAQIRINMQDMVVRAPFAGTIATKNTEVGEVISSVMMGQVGGTLPAGAICTLVDLKTLEVVADVNEASIGQLHEGQSAEVSVDAFPNRKWKGVLRQIIPTADRAKATVQVKVKIIDPGDRLLPEMSSSVSFLQSERTDAEMHEPARLWVPASAVANGTVAVVDAEKHIALRRVTTGAVREQRIEITNGIKSGDRIVTTGAEALKDGQLIRIE